MSMQTFEEQLRERLTHGPAMSVDAAVVLAGGRRTRRRRRQAGAGASFGSVAAGVAAVMLLTQSSGAVAVRRGPTVQTIQGEPTVAVRPTPATPRTGDADLAAGSVWYSRTETSLAHCSQDEVSDTWTTRSGRGSTVEVAGPAVADPPGTRDGCPLPALDRTPRPELGGYASWTGSPLLWTQLLALHPTVEEVQRGFLTPLAGQRPGSVTVAEAVRLTAYLLGGDSVAPLTLRRTLLLALDSYPGVRSTTAGGAMRVTAPGEQGQTILTVDPAQVRVTGYEELDPHGAVLARVRYVGFGVVAAVGRRP